MSSLRGGVTGQRSVHTTAEELAGAWGSGKTAGFSVPRAALCQLAELRMAKPAPSCTSDGLGSRTEFLARLAALLRLYTPWTSQLEWTYWGLVPFPISHPLINPTMYRYSPTC